MTNYKDNTMFLQQPPQQTGSAMGSHGSSAFNSMQVSSACKNNMRMLNQMLLQQQQQQQHNFQDLDASVSFQTQDMNHHNLGLFASSTLPNQDQGLGEPIQMFQSNTPHSTMDNVHNVVSKAAVLTQAQGFQSNEQQQQQQFPVQEISLPNSSDHVAEDGSDAGASNNSNTTENRFRHYQADAWTSMLEELIEYRRKNGHCNVPHTSKELPALGRWVKRQRYQYKLMQEGKKESTMTPERAQVLEQVGFVWDAHGSTWHRRFKELHAFFLMQGHCNVPSNFPANPQLSTWVKFQRRQYKALRNGGKAKVGGASGQSLTPVRIRALEELGFQWELRKSRSLK